MNTRTPINDALRERAVAGNLDFDDALNAHEDLERELEVERTKVISFRGAAESFRDIVLNQRGAMSENGMDNDQVNSVLAEFDYVFQEYLA